MFYDSLGLSFVSLQVAAGEGGADTQEPVVQSMESDES